MRTRFVIASLAWQSVAVATAVRRRMFNLIEVATSFDELGMTGRSSQWQIEWARVRIGVALTLLGPVLLLGHL